MSYKYELQNVVEDKGKGVNDIDKETDTTVEESPDDILIKLGGCGRYQVLLATVIQIMKTVVCFSMAGNAFFAYVPQWRCADDLIRQNFTAANTTTSVNSSGLDTTWIKECNPNGRKCTKFEYDPSISTLVNEFDLICDKSWVTATIISVQMAGMCLGSVVVGPIADHFGRRNPYMTGILLVCICQGVSYFSTNWIMYAVMRFLIGIGCALYLSIYCTLECEFTLSWWRVVVVGFPSWALESSLFALVAYLLHDWKHMTLFTAFMGLAFVCLWPFIPESFRWYVSKDRFKEAKRTVENVARWNKRKLSDSDFEVMRKVITSTEDEEEKNTFSFFVLFKTKALLKITIPLTVIWLSLGLVSYGVSFGIQKLSGNIYLNLFLFAIVSIPTKILAMLIANRFGRRASTIFGMTVTGLAGLIVGIVQNTDVPYKDDLTKYAALVAVSGIDLVWGPVQTLTLEVYPTVVRNTGFGVLSLLARFGATIGPQLVYLGEFVPGLLYFVVAALALLSVIGTLCLTETKGKELLDKMADDLNAKRKKEHTAY